YRPISCPPHRAMLTLKFRKSPWTNARQTPPAQTQIARAVTVRQTLSGITDKGARDALAVRLATLLHETRGKA
ncbi:hypothetical protein, partial [Burkholderia cenocepacia]|uniref:hypothetical protein n=1 Tax=Burkholderia cenocepacia TaxID=95486 RepID=UPI001B9CA33F